eukprot:gene238-322_t
MPPPQGNDMPLPNIRQLIQMAHSWDKARILLHRAMLERLVNERVRGTTPLHEACMRGQVLSVKWLLDVKSDPLALNRSGCIPLHFVCQSSDGANAVQIINMIYDKAPNMNINHCNERQDTPLHYASYNPIDSASTAICRRLIEMRAKVNQKNKQLDRPLQYAATRHNENCVQLLLENKADPTRRNVELNAAADIVLKRHQNPDLAAILLAKSPSEDRQHAMNWLPNAADRQQLQSQLDAGDAERAARKGRGSASQPLPRRQQPNPMEIPETIPQGSQSAIPMTTKPAKNVENVHTASMESAVSLKYDENGNRIWWSAEAPAAIGHQHPSKVQSVNLLQDYGSMSQFLSEFLSRSGDLFIRQSEAEVVLDNACGVLTLGQYNGTYVGPIDDNLRVLALKVICLIGMHQSLGTAILRNRCVHKSLEKLHAVSRSLNDSADIEVFDQLLRILMRYRSARANSFDSVSSMNNMKMEVPRKSSTTFKQTMAKFKDKMTAPLKMFSPRTPTETKEPGTLPPYPLDSFTGSNAGPGGAGSAAIDPHA